MKKTERSGTDWTVGMHNAWFVKVMLVSFIAVDIAILLSRVATAAAAAVAGSCRLDGEGTQRAPWRSQQRRCMLHADYAMDIPPSRAHDMLVSSASFSTGSQRV